MIWEVVGRGNVLKHNYLEALTYFAYKVIPVELLLVYYALPIINQLLEKFPSLRGVISQKNISCIYGMNG